MKTIYKNPESAILTFLFLLIFTSVKSQQWQNVSPTGYTYFSTVSFINENEGWVVARNDNSIYYDLLHTNDGAYTFEPIFSFPDYFVSWKMQMVDSLNGFARIDRTSGSEKYFWATHDGGHSWIDITDTTMFKPGGPLNSSYAFYFLDESTGFAGSLNSIYKTEDAGITWLKMTTPVIIDSSSSNYYIVNDLFFIDETYGWAANSLLYDNGFVLKTIDGGQSWAVCEPITGDLYKIHFADSLHGGVTGGNWSFGLVMFTENNFDTISHFYKNEWQQIPDGLFHQNDTTIWMSGYPAVIYKSTDGGASFVEYDTTFATNDQTDWIHEFQFYNNTGYAYAYSFILKMVDTLNTNIQQTKTVTDKLIIFPNPVNDHFSVELSTQKEETTLFEIYSASGILLKRTEIQLNAGYNDIPINVAELDSGVYVLKVTCCLKVFITKFIKQQ